MHINDEWNNRKNTNKKLTFIYIFLNLPQEFSSDPSVQSFSPLQNRPRSIQFPSPQAKDPSAHKGSSVTKSGLTLRSLFLNLQFFTASFQSQVCFSISKYKPAGQRIACRPWRKWKQEKITQNGKWLQFYALECG